MRSDTLGKYVPCLCVLHCRNVLPMSIKEWGGVAAKLITGVQACRASAWLLVAPVSKIRPENWPCHHRSASLLGMVGFTQEVSFTWYFLVYRSAMTQVAAYHTLV